jgi:CDP-glucose 4,6-dehydratase
MSKNILITGINGFVGSNLALDMLAEGHHVVGIVKDRNRKSRKDVLERCSIIRGSVEDPALVDNAVSHYEIDTVFHLAANSIVKVGVQDPVSNYSVNIMGTVNVLDSVRRINPEIKVVVASSDKSYGTQDKLPYTEDMKLVPECPYSTSKLCTDMLAQSYAKTYGLNVNVVRCSNIYGPGDMNTSRLVPNSILRILRGEKPMIYTGVAKYKRELIYVGDVCKAYAMLVEDGVPGHIYNIGINQFHTIQEIVEQISDLMGSEGIDIVEKDFPEIPYQWMDGAKLMALGWKPAVDLEEGLRRSIAWYTRQHQEEEEAARWAASERA